MRENKYFQHAITTTGIPAPWVKVTADGRVINAQPMQLEAQPGNSWLRMPFPVLKTSSEAPERKPPESATFASRRY
jgi:hypothetical protein